MVIVQFVTEKKSMTVGDNTIQVERLGSFLESLGKRSAKIGN